MNPKTFIFGIVFLLSLMTSMAQETEKPIIVHEAIGDTLDLKERDMYNLFPNIEGFQSAVFFLNSDSTLRVVVRVLRDTGVRDIEILQYRTLASLHDHIEKSRPKAASQGVDRIFLTNGTVLVGIIEEQTKEYLRIKTTKFGVVKVLSEEIDHVENTTQSVEEVMYGVVSDPNTTRAFLMPTAQTLPAGKGYIGVFELFLFTIAWSPADHLMLNGGLLLLPIPLEDQVYNFGLKFGFGQLSKDVEIGIGVQFLKIPEEEPVGIGYGVIRFGNVNNKLNIGAGFGFDLGQGSATDPVFLISGDTRLGQSVKLLAETWILPGADILPFMIGVRFFGSRLSGDIGLLYPLGGRWESPLGLPVGNLIYNF